MPRNVRGTLFVEYVRMIRSRIDVDWHKYLEPEDLSFLGTTIHNSEWYPMETFERMGVAILKEIAHGDLEAVRAWGQASVSELRDSNLVVEDDPLASIMRFQVFRADFFDFPAIQFGTLVTGRASIRVSYGMGAVAEEAACMQTMGFFERLVEVSGCCAQRVSFESRSWEGDPTTIILLEWS